MEDEQQPTAPEQYEERVHKAIPPHPDMPIQQPAPDPDERRKQERKCVFLLLLLVAALAIAIEVIFGWKSGGDPVTRVTAGGAVAVPASIDGGKNETDVPSMAPSKTPSQFPSSAPSLPINEKQQSPSNSPMASLTDGPSMRPLPQRPKVCTCTSCVRICITSALTPVQYIHPDPNTNTESD